ncbi:MAG: hypothetical protein F6K30_07705 [Cyanothece sp. SIO2G6]|nr:hypothetical protein [Cyanothece sp. SIO2G6]
MTKDYRPHQLFSIFLTKDKIISPIAINSPHYTDIIQRITSFFFKTNLLKQRLASSSFIQQAILFIFLRKGIFGKFALANLSNFVNVGYSATDGNTNTIVHSDAGLCNFFTQVEGAKRWWTASPYQNKAIIQQLFQEDINTLDMSDPAFESLEYYDFQLNPGEMLYVPTNWLHGVVAPFGKNLSFYCRFPMTVKEMLRNVFYWRSLGIPVNRHKVVDETTQETAADLAEQQAEVLGQVKYYMQPHLFASRSIAEDEPEYVVGLYDVDRIAKTVTGAE